MKPLLRRAKAALNLLVTGQVSPAAPRSIAPSAQVTWGAGATLGTAPLAVGPGSILAIGEGASIDAAISIGEGCRVTIGSGCRLRNATLRVLNGAVLELGEGVIFDNPLPVPNPVVVDAGRLVVGEYARVQAELLVRFGGVMTIGRYTGIGYGSEIRCEERVDIGEYGLFSYDVCIYDTNTHSTDWRMRRSVIERMVHSGAGEDRRPDTSPIRIGDDVWIGKGAVILKGCQIGDRCIVGIRAVVGGGTYPADSTIVTPPPRVIAR